MSTVIEIFGDIYCPFAHAGLRMLDARRRDEGRDFRLWIRSWPLELVNGEPLDPPTDRHLALVGAEWEQGRARGVEGSPNVFVGDCRGSARRSTCATRRAVRGRRRPGRPGDMLARI